MKPIFRTKRTPQNRETAWPGRFNGPVLEPRFPQPGGKTLHLNPLKNYIRFWSGFEGFPAIFLQNALESMVLKRQGNSEAWPLHKAPFSVQNTLETQRGLAASQSPVAYKTHPSYKETAWPGRFKGPILEPRFPQPRGQNVTSGSTKKLYGCRQALQVSLQGSTDPFLNHVSPSPGGKTSRLDPLKNYTVVVKLCRFPCNFPTKRIRDQGFEATGKQQGLAGSRVLKRRGKSRAWPVHEAYFSYKTHASKQGNSMAWPVQGTHFGTTFPPAPGAKRHVWIH